MSKVQEGRFTLSDVLVHVPFLFTLLNKNSGFLLSFMRIEQGSLILLIFRMKQNSVRKRITLFEKTIKTTTKKH